MPVTLSGVTLRTTTSLSQWNPIQLFSSGEQGVWYDPSDFSTMFQDSAGTTPVTAVEQPVALLLDESRGGVGRNGAKRVNLLSFSEQFDNAAWGKTNCTITANDTTAPDGTITADKLTDDATSGSHRIALALDTGSAVAYTSSIYIKAGTASYAFLHLRGMSGNSWYTVVVDLSTGSVTATNTLGFPSGSHAVTRDASTGWCRITTTSTNNLAGAGYPVLIVGISNAASPTFSSGFPTYSGSGSTIYIWGADLRLASEASTLPTYQRITSDWVSTIPGNHATQSTAASRPVLSARYNQFTYTEQFNNSFWAKSSEVSVTANAANAPDGTTTADKLYASFTFSKTAALYAYYTTAAISYTYSVAAKADGANFIFLFWDNGADHGRYFDLSNGTLGNSVGTAITDSSITSLGSGWFRCSITFMGVAGTTYPAMLPSTTNATGRTSQAGSSPNGVLIWGADLRVANDGVGLPSYQRVDTSTSYDTVGFPPYLRFDGVDDWLALADDALDVLETANQPFAIFAGVRRLAGGAFMDIFSSANNGSSVASDNDYVRLQLNDATDQVSGAIRDFTTVITTKFASAGAYSATQTFVTSWSRSSTTGQARVNEVAGTAVDQTQGALTLKFNSVGALKRGSAGTMGAYLNGRLYGLIVCGAAKGSGEISNTETWLNARTRAY